MQAMNEHLAAWPHRIVVFLRLVTITQFLRALFALFRQPQQRFDCLSVGDPGCQSAAALRRCKQRVRRLV